MRRGRNWGASRHVTACRLKSAPTRSTQTATGYWKVTGKKSEPVVEAARASAWARCTASSGRRLSPAYFTLLKSTPSGMLSVSTIRKEGKGAESVGGGKEALMVSLAGV